MKWQRLGSGREGPGCVPTGDPVGSHSWEGGAGAGGGSAWVSPSSHACNAGCPRNSPCPTLLGCSGLRGVPSPTPSRGHSTRVRELSGDKAGMWLVCVGQNWIRSSWCVPSSPALLPSPPRRGNTAQGAAAFPGGTWLARSKLRT